MRYVGVSKTKNGTWVARCGDHYFGTYRLSHWSSHKDTDTYGNKAKVLYGN